MARAWNTKTYHTKSALAKNNKAINNFVGGIAGAMVAAGKYTMNDVAKSGLEKMLDAAEFGDYTGELANSYQAIVLNNGLDGTNFKGMARARTDTFDTQTGAQTIMAIGNRHGTGSNSEFDLGKFGHLYTSYGMSGATKISSRTKAGSWVLRRPRSGRHADAIKVRHKVSREGYGRDISAAKGFRRWFKAGIVVLFNNPTPYATAVHEGFGLKEGQMPNRVFPTGRMISGSEMMVIYESVLRKATNKLKHSRKRRR